MTAVAPLGIVDTLSAGFAALNKRLWIALLPALLDFLLGFGPGISFNAVVEETAQLTQQVFDAQAEQAAVPEESSTALQQQTREAMESLRGTNLLGLLAWLTPNIVNATSRTPLPQLRGAALEISEGWSLAGAGLGLLLGGLLWASIYYAALAQGVREEPPSVGGVLAKSLRGWGSLTLFFLGMALLAIPAGLMSLLVLLTASVFGTAVLSLVVGTVAVLGIVVAYSLYFADDAIFAVEASPVRAAWYSASVLWTYFWPALGFVLLVNVVLTGTAIAWSYVAGSPAGLLAAAAGHSYIATGLSAAGMIFFRQRFLAWRKIYATGRAVTRS